MVQNTKKLRLAYYNEANKSGSFKGFIFSAS